MLKSKVTVFNALEYVWVTVTATGKKKSTNPNLSSEVFLYFLPISILWNNTKDYENYVITHMWNNVRYKASVKQTLVCLDQVCLSKVNQ